MNELSVYNQLKASPKECLDTIKREIGIKVTCMPFAVKVTESLKTLNLKTQAESIKAADTLLSGLQTLWQGGITGEDYDKIDFVKRGGVIVPSARVEAFLRAAARKGYRITDTIIAVPQEDGESTYFKENFYNGDIVYTLEDKRNNNDRAVTAQRLIDGYFSKFICRLDVHEVSSGKRLAMSVCEMSNAEMIEVSNTSEQGIYKSKWEEYVDNWGKKRKRKVISDELNSGSFWVKWTGEMVNKTIIRRGLKRIREVLPELKETIYAFDAEEQAPIEVVTVPDIEVPVETLPQPEDNVDLNKLTPEQLEESKEMLEIFKANPKLAEDKTKEIIAMFKNGADKQSVINSEYASITVLRSSKSKWEQLRGYFE